MRGSTGRARPAAFLGALFASMVIATPAGAALKPGDVLVADQQRILKIDPATGKLSILSSNSQPVNSSSQFLADPTDLLFTPSGRVLVADYDAFDGFGGVIEIDPATGKQRRVAANDMPVNDTSKLFNAPTGLALLPSGRILVLNRSGFDGNGGVVAVDPASGKETTFSSNTQPVNDFSKFFADPRGGIEIGRNGQALVTDCNAFDGNGGVISINPANGKQSKLSANDQPVNDSSKFFDCPNGIVNAPSGRLFLSEQFAFPTPPSGGGVIAVDPASGKQAKISANDQPVNNSSRYYEDPAGLGFALDGRILVVATDAFGTTGCSDLEGCGGVIAADPTTGKQSVFSANTQPVNASSQLFSNPSGIAVMPPRCDGKPATIVGTPKGEKIVGTAGPDVIAALGGKDKIASLGANDRVCGGSGADLINGGKGRDRLRGEAGRDGLFGGAGRDLLVGGKGRDKLRGGPGRDRQKQ